MGAQGRILLLTFFWLDLSMQLANASRTSDQQITGERSRPVRFSNNFFSQNAKRDFFRPSEPETDPRHLVSRPSPDFSELDLGPVASDGDIDQNVFVQRQPVDGRSRSRNTVIVEETSPAEHQSLDATVGQQRTAVEERHGAASEDRGSRNKHRKVKMKSLPGLNQYNRGPLPVNYHQQATLSKQNHRLTSKPSAQTNRALSLERHSADAESKKQSCVSRAKSQGAESAGCEKSGHRDEAGIFSLNDPESQPEGSASRPREDTYGEGTQYQTDDVMTGYGLEDMAIDFFLDEGFRNSQEDSEQDAAHSGGLSAASLSPQGSANDGRDQQYYSVTKTGTGLTLDNTEVIDGKIQDQGTDTQYSRNAYSSASFKPACDAGQTPPTSIKSLEPRVMSTVDVDDNALYGLVFMDFVQQMLMQTAREGDATVGGEQMSAANTVLPYPLRTFRENPSLMGSREMWDEDRPAPVASHKQPHTLRMDGDQRHGSHTAATDVKHASLVPSGRRSRHGSSVTSGQNRILEKMSQLHPGLATKQTSGPDSGQPPHFEREMTIATSANQEGELPADQQTAATNGRTKQQTTLRKSQSSKEERNSETSSRAPIDRKVHRHREFQELTQTGDGERTRRHRHHHPFLLHHESSNNPQTTTETVYSHGEHKRRVAPTSRRPLSSHTGPREGVSFGPYLGDFAHGIQTLKRSFHTIVKRSAGAISNNNGRHKSKRGKNKPHSRINWPGRSPRRRGQSSGAVGLHHTSHTDALKLKHRLPPAPDTGHGFVHPVSRFGEHRPGGQTHRNSEKQKRFSWTKWHKAQPVSEPETKEKPQMPPDMLQRKRSRNSDRTPNRNLRRKAKRLRGYRENCTPVGHSKKRLRSNGYIADGQYVSHDGRDKNQHDEVQLKTWLSSSGTLQNGCTETAPHTKGIHASMHPTGLNPLNRTDTERSKVTSASKSRHSADYSPGFVGLPHRPDKTLSQNSLVRKSEARSERGERSSTYRHLYRRSRQKLPRVTASSYNGAGSLNRHRHRHSHRKFPTVTGNSISSPRMVGFNKDVPAAHSYKNHARHRRNFMSFQPTTLQQACALSQRENDLYNMYGPGHTAWCNVTNCDDSDRTIFLTCEGFHIEVRDQFADILDRISAGYPVIVSCGDICNDRCFCDFSSLWSGDGLWDTQTGPSPLNITATVVDSCVHKDCHSSSSGTKVTQTAYLKATSLPSSNVSNKTLQG